MNLDPRPDFLTRHRVVDTHCANRASRNDVPTVGTEGQAELPVALSPKLTNLLPGINLPHTHARHMKTDRGQVTTVAAESHLDRGVGRGQSQCVDFLASPCVPHPHRSIRAGGNEEILVLRVEGHVGYRASVCEQGAVLRSLLRLRCGIPDPDGGVLTRRCQLMTVRAERQAGDVVDVAAQREDLVPRPRVPDLDGLIQARGRDTAAVGAEDHAP
jgi:hypothetical protein